MLLGTALRFANHVLTGEPWARARLRSFAGQVAHFEFGTLRLPVLVTSDGLLAPAERSAVAAVTITLPGDVARQALTDPSSLLAGARIAGSVDLAETLGFVFRNVRWNPEDDLSRLTGDIVARRLSQGAQQLVRWHLRTARNFALNIADYLTEENPAVAKRADLSRFVAAVNDIRDDCTGFEQRLRKLESR